MADSIDYIPHRPKDAKYRTLIVLLDGTGDTEDKDATNIVLLKNMLKNDSKDDPKKLKDGSKKLEDDSEEQLVHYFTGIGADTAKNFPGLIRYGGTKAMNMINKAWGNSFQKHIIEAYSWLVTNYKDGDKICIFGFSRGAYSARALAGMIKAVGLLRDLEKPVSVQKAYDLYAKHKDLPEGSTPGSEDSKRREAEWKALEAEYKNFRSTNGVQTPGIEFLGCWDSVNSVGMMDNIKLAYTATNDFVRTFRHAVALDERRVKFKQNMWSKYKPDQAAVAADAESVQQNAPSDRQNAPPDVEKAKPNGVEGPPFKTNVEEVWFAGCHCDVGGGSVLNGTRPNLAHISLRWMIRKCFKRETGMMFDPTALAKLGIKPSHLHPHVRLRPKPETVIRKPNSQTIQESVAPGWIEWGTSFLYSTPGTELTLPTMSEEELDACDALAPIYDQLDLKWFWSIMEKMPIKHSKYDPATDGYENAFEHHNGAGRTILPPECAHGGKIRVHRTVQWRMEGTYKPNGSDEKKHYTPKAMVRSNPDNTLVPLHKMVQDGKVEWVWD